MACGAQGRAREIDGRAPGIGGRAPMTDVWLAVTGGVVIAVATMARVYRGGTTANDHAVAAVVAGCVGIYPALWWGARAEGLGGPSDGSGAAAVALGVVFAVAATSIYGLFHVLDSRREPGAAIWIARLSQPAIAFSLWAGLLLVLRGPLAAFTGAPILWPGALLLLPAGLALWGSAWTWIGGRGVRTVVLPVPGLPAPLVVVHLSDLHVGPTMPRADVLQLLERAEGLNPDLIVITGDFVTPFSEGEHGALLEGLARLTTPTYACLGNHDLPIAATLPGELAAAGVHLLVDTAALVEVRGVRVELVGVNFHWRAARARLAEALESLPPAPGAHTRLLLAHDPRLFAWVPDGRFDLVLAGHTHGGQVGTDMFGLPWSVLRPLGVYDQGTWRRGTTRLYVHRGNWHTGLPPRMGIAGEIVAHRLVPEASTPPQGARQASIPPQGA